MQVYIEPHSVHAFAFTIIFTISVCAEVNILTFEHSFIIIFSLPLYPLKAIANIQCYKIRNKYENLL